MTSRSFPLALVFVLTVMLSAAAVAAERPRLDRAANSHVTAAVRAAFDRARSDPALQRIGRVTGMEPRYALPTFLWATERAAPPASDPAQSAAATAARAHLARVAPFYRLDASDVDRATLRHLHDTGRGGVIASFVQVIDGVEVFRDEAKVLMDRGHGLIAVSGYLPSRSLLGPGEARVFRWTIGEATARALGDFTGAGIAPGSIRSVPGLRGGYQVFEPAGDIPGFETSEPLRAKPVWFHLPESLIPAYYVEVQGQAEAFAYVIAARDGEVLFRKDLIANESYAYRVWADGAPSFVPWDGPQGTAPSPHPTGVPDLYNPPFVAPQLVTLQNGPISTLDPWLPPGSTETVGNNVDAYCDLASPDGLTAGDFRAPRSGPGAFDYTYDVNQDPASTPQRHASITELFYAVNFFHDWYYDAGFTEAEGNAQASNYGRGGLEADPIRAEAQDYEGTNSANMTTPADGGRPRMQMLLFNNPAGRLTVSTPASIAGNYHAGIAVFGPQTFNVSGTLVAAVDAQVPTGDACSPLVNNVAGKIVLIRRGTCEFVTKVLNAQAGGALGAIIQDNEEYANPINLGGSGGVSIPVLSVTLDVGDAIRAHLGETVSVVMNRSSEVRRDGTIDNQVIAHEWAHYLSNRLVGNAAGLASQQSNGMGEGWSDFNALLLMARAGDDFHGANPIAVYASSNSAVATNVYYFGTRRYPYSIDETKDPLTFRHIQLGLPLPAGPPVAYGADGSVNNEVHRTGEVWCTMLWECYAKLLLDPGRLTFTQAQQRMRDYLVASLMMTPHAPTFTEARDALLAVAAANDPLDLNAFWLAFAKRGCGVGAVSPDRYATDQVGVVESYQVGGDLAIRDLAFTPTAECDHDGYLDNGEIGQLTFVVQNVGGTVLTGSSATISSSSPAVSFPNGNTIAVPGTAPFGSASITVPVRLNGAGPVSALDFQVAVNDPALLVPGPRTQVQWAYGQCDERLSVSTENFETVSNAWTYGGSSGEGVGWSRKTYGATDRRLYAFDPGATTDAYAMTPPLFIAGNTNFHIYFQHAYHFENTHDGGVIEISTNGGATWTDLGSKITNGGYNGTMAPGSALAGRPAWTGTSPNYPALSPVDVEMDFLYAGLTVRFRFRAASDDGVGDAGWSIANMIFRDNSNPVFPALTSELSSCTSVGVENGEPSAELAFSLAGANPVRGSARFRLALPAESRVDIAVFDVTGRRVARVADGWYTAGVHEVWWDPAAGRARLPGGLYFARMSVGDRRIDRRVMLLP